MSIETITLTVLALVPAVMGLLSLAVQKQRIEHTQHPQRVTH